MYRLNISCVSSDLIKFSQTDFSYCLPVLRHAFLNPWPGHLSPLLVLASHPLGSFQPFGHPSRVLIDFSRYTNPPSGNISHSALPLTHSGVPADGSRRAIQRTSRDVAIESTFLALVCIHAHTGFRHQLSLSFPRVVPCVASLSYSPLFHFLSLSLSIEPSSWWLYICVCACMYVCVTYLRSCRLSLSSTPVTVTNDALSIRIVRREGENGEHLLAPYLSWHQPYELLRFLRHLLRRHPRASPLRCVSRYSINLCQWERNHLQLFFKMPYSKCTEAKDDR